MNVNQKALNELGVAPFDVVEHFHDEKFMEAYLREIMADGDVSELASALRDVARYKGRLAAVEEAGLTEAKLLEMLAQEGARKMIINRVLEIAGVDLRLEPFISGSYVSRSKALATLTATQVLVTRNGRVLGTVKRTKDTKKLA
jgi:probable addiction module antidote protein